ICQFAEQQRQSGQGPFLDSPLWLTLEETTSLFEVCATLCQASGVAQPEFQSMTPSDLVVTMCDLLQQGPRPRLVVLDQFENWLDPQTRQPRSEHPAVSLWLEQLNNHLSSSRLLFTSRLYPHGQRQPLDAYVQRYALTGLSQPEGLQLLRLGHLQESDAELASTISYYQGHPLALAWLRDLLQGNRVISLTVLVQDISYKQRFANDLAHSVLHYMYTQQLTEEQRELLRAFAIYRQPVPLQATQQIVQAHQASAALSVLLDLELLQEVSLLVYRVPPVIRDFVQAQLNASDLLRADEQLSPVHQIAASYYQELFAATSRSSTSPSRDDILLLLEAAWHLCQAGRQSEAARLIHREHLFRALSRWGDNILLLDLYHSLLPETWDAAPELVGQLYHEMGTIYNALGQKSEARLAYERSLSFLRQTDEPALLAAALNDLGTVYRSLDQESLVSACYQEAWALCEQAGEPFPQRGITLNNQGRLLYEQGLEQERQRQKVRATALYQEALSHYEQALAAHLRNHLPEEEGWTLLNLADAYASLDQRSQALAHYRQALSHFRELGERRGEGTALNNLGLLLAYDPTTREQAASCYTLALCIFRSVGDRWQERKTLKNLGHWLLISVPPKEPARSQAYLSSMACFFAARDPLAQPYQARTDLIPAWLLASLLQDLGEFKAEECIQIAEARSWQIVEELLQLPRDFV
ncbi:MAG: tetratricopeptide repeat protein, partial [Ktedonobacteraceae bacterium]|nr:tetratricopeptide repeat protein [Ktedonobacteraceae bacterium]